MSSEKKYKVFLVDDHAIVREGLAKLINQEEDMEICGSADDAPVALNMLFNIEPDIAIVDLSLASSDGLDLIKSIKARYPNVHILVLSMREELVFAERCVRAGASGYIMKSEKPTAIIDAMRKIIKGKIYFSDRMTEHVLNKAMNLKNCHDRDVVETLSDREFQVFQLIGNGFASKQIAENLNLSVKTIDAFRESMKHKLGLKSSAELTQFAIKWAHYQDIIS
ncbi:response regulator transcription factor [Seleniivibrio woodruffii]|uniref:LuxR family two component transcriptional regulator n=1 Tax=Seleniivibrio woodruffii TaxID=1078050 RepID=A0A4R1K5J0_9BACT|nr:response regulator transcription factor [Seleniivibrio woodruffii]TCK59458.1 LuxR family two component transcriptional regulator [Seleniivibrio woodruffii]TVZ35501.1 LuxR family two component transcriptional regulator [Seleniivibrio woodruffii]